MLKTLSCLSALLLGACVGKSPIELALSSDAPEIDRVMRNLSLHEVQILFTEVERTETGEIVFIDDEFQVSDDFYHYPASTVKFPVALLALEKLEEQNGIDRYTRFLVEGETAGSSVTNELIELFVISDNQAYNRLFEFLGQDEINRRLNAKGLEARISHRLSVPDSDLLDTRVIRFSSSDEFPVIFGPIENQAIEILPLQGLSKGLAYYEDGEKQDRPFDFSEKNYLPLRTLHSTMQRLIFPDMFAPSEQFRISEANRHFVIETMGSLPREAGFSEQEYPDGYAKFLVLGDQEGRASEQFEIHNKSGWAYGYLTDSAYIVDRESQREFFITASIHVNANRTFNDDEYEYDEIGVPFLAELGRQLVGN